MNKGMLQFMYLMGLMVAFSGLLMILYDGFFHSIAEPERVLLSVPISYVLLVLPAALVAPAERKNNG